MACLVAIAAGTPLGAGEEIVAEHRTAPVEESGAASGAILPSGDRGLQAEELLKMARHRERAGLWNEAGMAYARILLLDASDEVRQTALLEKARMRHRSGDYVKSVAAYEKYARLFPNDPRLPEAFMEAGLLYREMGLPELAIAQFYKVMNSSLRIRAEDFRRYRDTVLQAQIEIAETYFEMGDYREAANFFQRLMQLDIEPGARPEILFRWGYCHYLLDEPERAMASMRSLIKDFPASHRVPEARYVLARSLQAKGRREEAMGEALDLLRAQSNAPAGERLEWRNWQGAMGNPIANEFYRQGDFQRALAVYQALARLDDQPDWLWPVVYQIGLCFERLEQPDRALEAYRYLVAEAEKMANEKAGSHLQTVVDMAAWRKGHLQWQNGFDVDLKDLLAGAGESRSVDRDTTAVKNKENQ